jgi:choice-of-anchor A domain-containing protein
LCRASAGICDVSEFCTGSSVSCPVDSFQPSSTVCRVSAGVCDVAESCTGSGASCPADGFQPSGTVCRASNGPCDPQEVCAGNRINCPSDLSGQFETQCAGLAFPLAGTNGVQFTDFDVISFGGFVANTGDVESRLAVRNSASVGYGYSIGYQIGSQSTDRYVPYSVVVGNNFNFGSGAVYPEGNNYPYQVTEEDLFVGGTFTGEQDLADRVLGSCSGSSSCIATVQSYFDQAQACYSGYQNTLAAHSDNVAVLIQWSGLYLTCNSAVDATYYVTLTPDQMTQYTWISLSGCNVNARWVINVAGTADVTFTSGSFPATEGAVIYNVLGSGRKINVQWTQLDGSILAPQNILNQTGGVIRGKVVVADVIASLQMNKNQCFFPSAPQ